MSIAHLLEDFSVVTKSPLIELTELKLEEERLESFEAGYQAGWDDSAAAGKSDAARFDDEIAQTFRDLSFTYHEAYAGAVKALTPVIRQLVDTVLPPLARQMIAPQVSALMQEMLERHGRQPVSLACPPKHEEALRRLSEDETSLPLTIQVDEALSDGQVEIRFGSVAESELDLDELLTGVSAALDAFFEQDITEHKEIA